MNDQASVILASMVTYQDPVIQQVTGRVCHHVGGAAAIYTREEAEKKALARAEELLGRTRVRPV